MGNQRLVEMRLFNRITIFTKLLLVSCALGLMPIVVLAIAMDTISNINVGHVKLILGIMLIVMTIVVLIVAPLISKSVLETFQVLLEAQRNFSMGKLNCRIDLRGDMDSVRLFRGFNRMADLANLSYQHAINNTTKAVFGEVARQVAHDIRSPLAALNMVVKQNLQGIPEENRIIIRQQIDRIQDIANNLLVKNKNTSPGKIDPTITKAELLSSAIEEIVTEKRLNYRSYLGLIIESDIYDNESYGLFARINLAEFKRVISNLINNAVEAISDYKGKVVIRLESKDDHLTKVIIDDNGHGIPPEIVEKLCRPGISFGKEKNKESGNGLGLYHARTCVESWGGVLNIKSEVNKGTKISLSIPKIDAPKWFAPQVDIASEQVIVVLDDDQGIHHTWDNRFSEIIRHEDLVKIIHLSNPNSFNDWIENEKNNYKNVLYLSDYELLGYDESGLDLIEKYALDNAILVTSHYEDEIIRERCNKLGVKLIPKMLVGFVPIKMIDNGAMITEGGALVIHNYYDAVYVDDDMLLRKCWDITAKKKGINLLTLPTINEFEKHAEKISKESTVIYLDRNLDDDSMKGEEFAKILHERGYKNLNLATGEGPDNFSDLTWLKVCGKEFPQKIPLT